MEGALFGLEASFEAAKAVSRLITDQQSLAIDENPNKKDFQQEVLTNFAQMKQKENENIIKNAAGMGNLIDLYA